MKVGRVFSAMWFGSGRPQWHPRSVIRRTLAAGLTPLSAVFGSAVAWRRARLQPVAAAERLPVPVVVVGNLTVGGSGKTPLVIALVDALRAAGLTPGVVSRGYGGKETRARDATFAVDGDRPDSAERFGDEAVLVRQRTGAPVQVGRRRTDAARALLASHPEVDVLLSDDGLQHYALHRDFEVAVFDVRGAGNGKLLPAGPLREPLERLAEVDAIVLNGAGTTMPPGVASSAPTYRMELVPGDAYRVNDRSTTRPLASFRGRRLTAAAGIGNPERFFALLRSVGLSFHRMPLADHHRYDDNPFERRNSEAVLMTEKDAVKCLRFDESRMWAVPVSARVDPALVDAIVTRVRTGASRPTLADRR